MCKSAVLASLSRHHTVPSPEQLAVASHNDLFWACQPGSWLLYPAVHLSTGEVLGKEIVWIVIDTGLAPTKSSQATLHAALQLVRHVQACVTSRHMQALAQSETPVSLPMFDYRAYHGPDCKDRLSRPHHAGLLLH